MRFHSGSKTNITLINNSKQCGKLTVSKIKMSCELNIFGIFVKGFLHCNKSLNQSDARCIQTCVNGKTDKFCGNKVDPFSDKETSK